MQSILRAISPLLALVALTSWSLPTRAQPMDEKFQDLFVTAGYCTAFGAAIGAAALAWEPDPAANLRYVAMGASLGFIGGSVMGTYVIFLPGLGDASPSGKGVEALAMGRSDGATQGRSSTVSMSSTRKGRTLVVRPLLDRNTWQPMGIEGALKLAEF